MTGWLPPLVGVLVGCHVATWGAYKDVPYEGFRLTSYLRSIVLATVVAGIAAVTVPGRGRPGTVVVLIGVVYAVERLATEAWKAVLREQAQDRYTIPMRLAIGGRPVNARAPRYLAGAVLAAAVLAAAWAGSRAEDLFPGLPPWLVTAAVGSTGGWATAIGGAWKDAPIEGFSGWKFLRSPAVATAWAIPLSLLTTHWLPLGLAAAGYAVAGIETYKTFLTRDRPPGKFAGSPVRHRRPRLRRTCLGVHCGLWTLLAVVLVDVPVLSPHGLTTDSLNAVDERLPPMLLTGLGLAAIAYVVAVVTEQRANA